MAEVYKTEDSLIEETIKQFKCIFKCDAQVVAIAPGRVNLIGEHTDYNDGFVLPMAIPLCTVVVGCHRKSSKDQGSTCRIQTLTPNADDPKYIEIPLPSSSSPLQPGLPKWANYVKGVLAHFKGPLEPFDILINTSVPIGGGLSSSASLEVATYTFLDAISEHEQETSLLQKAQACQKAEHDFPGMPCGIMDQYISFMGKKGHALLIDCRSLESELVPMTDQGISILIVNSNVRHELTGTEYSERRQSCEEACRILGKASLRDAHEADLETIKEKGAEVMFRRVRHVISEIKRTEDAAKALKDQNYQRFGELMYQSHISLRDDYEVSCPELNELVEAAMTVSGVFGARMTGGGFGGCIVALLKSSTVDQCVSVLQERYSEKATYYICTPADGAHYQKM